MQLNRNVVWIIWGFLLMSTFMYGAIGWQTEVPESKAQESLVRILSLVAAVNLTIGFGLRFIFISWPALQGKLDLADPKALKRYVTVQIVIFALTEAVAVYGLVLRLSGADTITFGSFLGVAILCLLLHAPIQSETRR